MTPEHGRQVPQNGLRHNARYAISGAAERFIAASVRRHATSVIAASHFDGGARLRRREVDDEPSDDDLSPEHHAKARTAGGATEPRFPRGRSSAHQTATRGKDRPR